MSLAWLPNALSVGRILLVGPAVYLLLNEAYVATLALFFVAGVSDGVDGWLAKRFNWASRLGAFLDAAADKLLMAAMFVSLGWLGIVPWWLVGLIFLRDLCIVTGAWFSRRHLPDYRVRPFFTSKVNTAVQIVFVLVVIADAAWNLLAPELMSAAVTVSALSVLVSGLHYLHDWLRALRTFKRGTV